MNRLLEPEALDLQRGLFLIRYKSADNEHSPPNIAVSIDNESQGEVELILPPGVTHAILRSPGACLVVRATNDCRLWTTIELTDPDGSNVVSIELTELSNDQVSTERVSEENETVVDLSNLRIRGHVAMIGDVVAGNATWIAGPNAPARIEGFAIEWPDKPQGIELRYAAAIGVPNPAKTKLVKTGQFVGTRGRGLPLTGVIFELSGADSRAFQLVVDAVFPSSNKREIGQRVTISSAAGHEPLLGLRVAIERREGELSSTDPKRAQTPPRPSSARTNEADLEFQHIQAPATTSRSSHVASQSEGRPPATVGQTLSMERSGRVRAFRMKRLPQSSN